ncbi:hypothetical protein ABEG63_15845 [Chryseobacterium sp. C39-AII1]|uniref:hypothetical protein n=1 Tax=Chryseobacterium sp. C39-AII1 TaxID=3080332 RepID=UPI00320A81C7
MKYLLLIPAFFLLNFEKDNSVTGLYKTTEDSFCNPKMSINIKKNQKGYYFTIYRNRKNITSGKLTIRINDDDEKVLKMKNSVGILRSDSIIIQNSGNETNQYNNFKNCSAKYLIFLKEK